MSRLFTELSKEAEKQQQSLQKKQGQNQKKSTSDAETPITDITNRRRKATLDSEKLVTIIKELSEITVATYGTPVRLSAAEKRDIEDFIYINLRKKGITGKTVSNAKLMRYALRYMMKVHDKEFVAALDSALRKDETLSI